MLLGKLLVVKSFFRSQIGGAFCGAAIAHGIYNDRVEEIIDSPVQNVTCYFATCPNTEQTVNTASMFFDQVIGTFMLVSTVMSTTDPKNAFPPGLAPLFIGLSATAVGVAYGGNAG